MVWRAWALGLACCLAGVALACWNGRALVVCDGGGMRDDLGA